jgi:hypothetical protein
MSNENNPRSRLNRDMVFARRDRWVNVVAFAYGDSNEPVAKRAV